MQFLCMHSTNLAKNTDKCSLLAEISLSREICWIINNSAVHCLIALKFGTIRALFICRGCRFVESVGLCIMGLAIKAQNNRHNVRWHQFKLQCITVTTFVVFTALHICRAVFPTAKMSVRLSVCLSVCPSVHRTRELWQNERKFRRDAYTIWKVNSCSFSDT